MRRFLTKLKEYSPSDEKAKLRESLIVCAILDENTGEADIRNQSEYKRIRNDFIKSTLNDHRRKLKEVIDCLFMERVRDNAGG